MVVMSYLLDTCAFLWWWSDPERLSRRALALIRDPDNEFYVSAASAWEASTKWRIG
jgi:PIN domain nuclease of toxin-antitoxin system